MCSQLSPKSRAETIKEGTYNGRVLGASDEGLSSCFRLRFEYFVKTKKWVASSSQHQDMEVDSYDPFVYHLGVFEGDSLFAYLRVLPWQKQLGFMLEHEFRCLLSDAALTDLVRWKSLEISRLVLAPELSPEAVLPVTELLFKLLYQFCLQNDVEHLYAVVEPGWLRRFQRCFHLPFRAIGDIHRFPDGTRAVAAHASLRNLEDSLREAAPEKLQWYQSP